MSISPSAKGIAALLVFLAWFAVPSNAADACKQEPKLVSDEQRKLSLVLPDSVREFIHAKFPDLRVPGQSDMKGLWATETEPGSLPYFAKGDFNGDGRMDFALILASEKEYWLVIFHGEGCAYTIGYKTGGFAGVALQTVFLRTIPKGTKEELGAGKSLLFDTDAVEWTTVGGSVALVHWEKTKYEIYEFGGE